LGQVLDVIVLGTCCRSDGSPREHDLVESRNVYRAKAVFELAARAGTDEAAAVALGELSRTPVLRNDRLDGYVSLAWAAIIGLLAGETPRSREIAYYASRLSTRGTGLVPDVPQEEPHRRPHPTL
jgi:hypothetical protein